MYTNHIITNSCLLLCISDILSILYQIKYFYLSSLVANGTLCKHFYQITDLKNNKFFHIKIDIKILLSLCLIILGFRINICDLRKHELTSLLSDTSPDLCSSCFAVSE